MQALEIPQVEGLNSAAVDLFDPAHASKVLRAFGRAFGKLPDGELTDEQARFLNLSVQGLARDGKVVSVRLALFAEMMKGRPWTVAEGLEAVGGGREGVDRSFLLEETFNAPGRARRPTSRTSLPRGRARGGAPARAARIRGRMQPVERLRGPPRLRRPARRLPPALQILDGELR